MNTATLQNVNLMIPEFDMDFLRQLVDRVGWKLTTPFKSGIGKDWMTFKYKKIPQKNIFFPAVFLFIRSGRGLYLSIYRL